MYSYLCQILGVRDFTSKAGKPCTVVTLLFRHMYRDYDKWEVVDVFVSGKTADDCRTYPAGMMCRVETMPTGRIVGVTYDDAHTTIFD